MKPLTIAFSIAALALPLLAQTEDSPLVRAAKATGRLSKKPKIVITNDTLVLSGGHLATTDVTTTYPKAGPPPTVASPYAAIPKAQATPQLQAPGSGVNSQPPPAVNSQPPTAMNSQPQTAQTTPVTVSTTSAVPYTSTTQPPVVSVKPPQP